MSMDREKMIHIAAEAAVVGGITIYLLNRITALEEEVKLLKGDVQVVAKRNLHIEQNHATAIKQIMEAEPRSPRPKNPIQPRSQQPPIQTNVPMRSVQHHPQSRAHHHHTQPSSKPKKVQFTDDDSSSEDSSEEESSSEDSSEIIEIPRPKKKTPPKKPQKRGKVKIAATRKAKSGNRDMDDVKTRAAEMARKAGSEE